MNLAGAVWVCVDDADAATRAPCWFGKDPMDGQHFDRLVRALARSRGAFSRRTLLKGAAASIVVTAGGGRSAAAVICPPPTDEECGDPVDVVVVGAGLAGLVAARELVKKGRSVVVLEAQNHVGGRMIRKQVGKPEQDAWVDLGGQWIGPRQLRIRALAKQLGVKWWNWNDVVVDHGLTRLRYLGKEATYDGSFVPFHGQDPPESVVPEPEVKDAKEAWKQLNALATHVNPEAPWEGEDAQRWDRHTLDDWLNGVEGTDGARRTPFAKFVIRNWALIGGSGAFEPKDVSLLHALFTQKQSPQNEGPETELFVGGAGQIPERLEQALRDRMVPIHLESPVRAIEQTDTGVTLRVKPVWFHRPAKCYRARYAIVAIPPILTAEIDFDPLLPRERRELVQRMPMGKLFKVHLVYEKTFWRKWRDEDGELKRLNGIAITDLDTTPFTVDSSPPALPQAPPDEMSEPGILTTFIAGDAAVEFGELDPEEQQAAVLRDLVRYFGEEAGTPSEFIAMDWPAEKWTRGAFTSYMGPGTWTTYGPAWRARVGRIHWAGTETATRWNGYFDGAVRSGEDAAAAVDAHLQEDGTDDPETDCEEDAGLAGVYQYSGPLPANFASCGEEACTSGSLTFQLALAAGGRVERIEMVYDETRDEIVDEYCDVIRTTWESVASPPQQTPHEYAVWAPNWTLELVDSEAPLQMLIRGTTTEYYVGPGCFHPSMDFTDDAFWIYVFVVDASTLALCSYPSLRDSCLANPYALLTRQ